MRILCTNKKILFPDFLKKGRKGDFFGKNALVLLSALECRSVLPYPQDDYLFKS
jgi:hypothetical protein